MNRTYGRATLFMVVVALTACGDASAPAPTVATKLSFATHPVNTTAGAAISAVTVALQDDNGRTVPTATDEVTVALDDNGSGATLAGTTTVTPVNGVATFANLSITQSGSGFTLEATSSSLTSATSHEF